MCLLASLPSLPGPPQGFISVLLPQSLLEWYPGIRSLIISLCPLVSNLPPSFLAKKVLKRVCTLSLFKIFLSSTGCFPPCTAQYLLILLNWNDFLRDQHETHCHKNWSLLLIFHSICCCGHPFLQVSPLLPPWCANNDGGGGLSAVGYLSEKWSVSEMKWFSLFHGEVGQKVWFKCSVGLSPMLYHVCWKRTKEMPKPSIHTAN